MEAASGMRRRANHEAFERMLMAIRTKSPLQREIIDARVRAGLTQAELAAWIGTSQSTIARLESGLNSPSIKTLRKLAEVTGSRLVVRLDEVQM